MGQIMLPPGATWADYQNWLASPAGQQAQSAENERVRQRRESGGIPWLSNDGMVQLPKNWRQDLSAPSSDPIGRSTFTPGSQKPRSLPDPRQHVASGGQMSAAGKPMAVYGPSSPLGGGHQRPQGMYAAGTSPAYTAANPDTFPYRPGAAQPTQPPSMGTPYLPAPPGDIRSPEMLPAPPQGSAPQGGRGEMTPAQAFEASEFYNSAGQSFNASVRYLPGTSAEDRRRSSAELANSQGYFQRPGQAQPKQPPAQGMPYAKYGPGTTQEYMSQNPDTPQAPPKQPRSPASFTPGAGAGNLAYAAPENRPAPFQQRTTDWTGRQVDPQQGLAQRGAFVQSINQSRAGNAAQWGAGRQQAPTRNFGAMWGRAGDMAKQGWQNPLAGLFGGGK
jgi:hypothetical protein